MRAWMLWVVGVCACGSRTIGDGERTTTVSADVCTVPEANFGSDRAIAIGRCQPTVGGDARVWKIATPLGELDQDGRSPSWLVWFEGTASRERVTVGIRAGLPRPALGDFVGKDGCIPSRADPASSEVITPAAYKRLRPLAPIDAIHLTLLFAMNSECAATTGPAGVTALWQLPDLSSVRAVAHYSWSGAPGPLCGPCASAGVDCPMCVP